MQQSSTLKLFMSFDFLLGHKGLMTEYQTFQRPLKLVEMIVPKLLDMLRQSWQVFFIFLVGLIFTIELQISCGFSVQCCQCRCIQCTFGLLIACRICTLS